MTTKNTKAPAPGAIEFKKWVDFIHVNNALPDMPMNGNLGQFHTVVAKLAEVFTAKGYGEFVKALEAVLNADKAVNVALSAPYPAEQKAEGDDPRLVMGQHGDQVFRTLSMEDALNLPDIKHLVAKVLQVATVSLLFGESGTGKTFIALSIAFAVAYGRDWLGRKVLWGKVLYIYAEGKLGLKPRLKALLTHHAVAPSLDIQFIAVPLHLIQDRKFLFNTIAEQGPECVLVVVDTFSNCAAGIDQRDQEEVYPVLAVAQEITQTYGSHVLVVHHTNRQGTYSGSAAFRRHVDTMIEAEKEEGGQVITLHSRKQRDAEDFPDIKLRLQQVTLGTDPDTSEPLTSCVVVGSQAQTSREGTEKREQTMMLDILKVHTTLNTDKFKSASTRAGVSHRDFYRHLEHLTDTQQIVASPPVKGRSTMYSLPDNTHNTTRGCYGCNGSRKRN